MLKAEDYVLFRAKSRQAVTITDNHKTINHSLFARMKTMEMDESAATRETLAAGEITITANASVSFY
jgi:PHD/YefM family antitoxin component YafN of YafNO toxin-antitoxin module